MCKYSDDLVTGEACSWCGISFVAAHGYPVLCQRCYDNETPAERDGLQRATEEEF